MSALRSASKLPQLPVLDKRICRVIASGALTPVNADNATDSRSADFECHAIADVADRADVPAANADNGDAQQWNNIEVADTLVHVYGFENNACCDLPLNATLCLRTHMFCLSWCLCLIVRVACI